MVCSRCSQRPRVGPEECIFLSHLHTGNWSNFQSRLCFATAHQVNIVMIYTIYSHPLKHFLLNCSHWRQSEVRHIFEALMTCQAFWSIFNLNVTRQPTLTDNVSLVFKMLLYDTNRQQLRSNISLNQASQNTFATRRIWDELETPLPWSFHMHAAYVTRPQSNHSLCGVTPL